MNSDGTLKAQRPGLDWSGAGRALAGSWRLLHRYPPLSWLTPDLPVRLREASGAESLWIGDQRQDAGAEQLKVARFQAVELPDDLVLRRTMSLPALAEADLRDAVALDVRGASPFDPSDLVWGYRADPHRDGQTRVTAVLASRRMVDAHVRGAVPADGKAAVPEAWVMDTSGRPVVLEGYGESARLRGGARGRLHAYLLMGLGLVLLAALAVTPTFQIRLRAMQAQAAYQEIQQRAGPAVGQREALVRTREDLTALREAMAEHVDPLAALDLLTRIIPDDTWLQRVQAQGNRFTLSGQTPNAAGLMNTLSGNPGLRDVRAPSAATRPVGSAKENFVIELTIDASLIQPAAGSGASVGGTAAAAVAASGAVSTPSAAASAATVPASGTVPAPMPAPVQAPAPVAVPQPAPAPGAKPQAAPTPGSFGNQPAVPAAPIRPPTAAPGWGAPKGKP